MGIPKILIDLGYAHEIHGFAGIPQVSRLLFCGLAKSNSLEAGGLLFSNEILWRRATPVILEDQSVFLGLHLSNHAPPGAKLFVPRSIRQALYKHNMVINALRKNFTAEIVISNGFSEMIWRKYFASTAEASDRRLMMAQKYYITPLGRWRYDRAAMGWLSTPKLNTSGHDFILFHTSRAVHVSDGTTKLIRYHDGIPVFSSDTPADEFVTRLHVRAIKACERDSNYVCSSPSAVSDLEQISPKLADQAVVIPYFVPRIVPLDQTAADLPALAMMRVSRSTLGRSKPERSVDKWFDAKRSKKSKAKSRGKALAKAHVPDFILSVATIEPRKNYQRLIESWQLMRNSTGRDVKLVIIGRPGWGFGPILAQMEPHVAAGTLLHLEGVTQAELAIWYKAAKCFAFLSIAEGFGLPPVEAMQCGCPVLLSDIPAHRYSGGDGALFCDPYDHVEIATKLDYLTKDENAAEIQDQVRRGHDNAERFSTENVLPQWEEFLTSAKHRQPAQGKFYALSGSNGRSPRRVNGATSRPESAAS